MNPHNAFYADARVTYQGVLGVVMETPKAGENVLVRLENDDTLRRLKSKDLVPLKDVREVNAETPLALISQTQWDKANRLAIMCRMIVSHPKRKTAIRFAADRLGLCERSVKRALDRWRKDPCTSSLVDKKPGRKAGTRRLMAEVECVIDQCLKDIYLTEEKPDVSLVTEKIKDQCVLENLPLPADSTIRRRILGLNQSYAFRKRHGYKSWCDKYRPVPGNLSSERPMQIVEIDHTLADVILVSDDEHRLPIGRPWVTLAICVTTRMVVGVYISFDAPSSVSLAMCIMSMLVPKQQIVPCLDVKIYADWPTQGFPEEILVDNAQEMHAIAIQRGCAEYGISLRYRPVATPHWGGHIERLIGTLMRRLTLLPGATQRDVREREDKNVEARACLTLSEFRQWLISDITTQYHQSVHRGIGVTPLQKWKEVAKGEASARPWSEEEVLKCFVHFLPFNEHPVKRTGIEHEGLFYWNDGLIPYISDDHVYDIRYDPRDIRRVYFVTPKGELIVVPCTKNVPAVPYVEWNNNRKEARKRGQDGIDLLVKAKGADDNSQLVKSCRKKQKKAHRAASKNKERANDVRTMAGLVPQPPRREPPHATDQVFTPQPFQTERS
jgi:putative transposase